MENQKEYYRRKWSIEYGDDMADYLIGRIREGEYPNKPWVIAMANIRQRCNNPRSKGYKYYGGRGVKCKITTAQMGA